MTRTLTLMTLLSWGCDDSKGTQTPLEEQSCAVNVTFTFPDGTRAEYDECQEVLLDATYEFDPDTPPEVRSFKLQFTGTDDPDFECWLIVTSHGICGPGRYGVGSGQSTSVEFATYDCAGVGDEFEGRFRASSGLHLIDTVDAGSEVGNFENEDLFTTFKGNLEAETSNGILVQLSNYEVLAYIRGTDAEEADCMPAS